MKLVSHLGADVPAAPIWGGLHGYQVGVVNKTLTHDPDPEKHSVIVRWGEHESEFSPEFLEDATEGDKDVAYDFASGFILDQDVWVLVKTPEGGLGLSIVETNMMASVNNPDNKPYIVSVSKQLLKKDVQSNGSIINAFLSSVGSHEARSATLLGALQLVYEWWELPELTSVPLPLPEFLTISQAASTVPDCGDKSAALMFHLPKNLLNYAAESGSGA